MGVTTLRPRSGNEYQKIDRSILQGEPKVIVAVFTIFIRNYQLRPNSENFVLL